MLVDKNDTDTQLSCWWRDRDSIVLLGRLQLFTNTVNQVSANIDESFVIIKWGQKSYTLVKIFEVTTFKRFSGIFWDTNLNYIVVTAGKVIFSSLKGKKELSIETVYKMNFRLHSHKLITSFQALFKKLHITTKNGSILNGSESSAEIVWKQKQSRVNSSP